MPAAFSADFLPSSANAPQHATFSGHDRPGFAIGLSDGTTRNAPVRVRGRVEYMTAEVGSHLTHDVAALLNGQTRVRTTLTGSRRFSLAAARITSLCGGLFVSLSMVRGAAPDERHGCSI